MTESEWLAFTDPWDMLDQMRGPIDRIRGLDAKSDCIIATDRQFLLWGSACCRRLGPFVDDARWLNAIRVVEQFADGEVAYPEVLLVGSEMQKWFEGLGGYESCAPASMVARSCADLSGGADSAFDSMRTPFLCPVYDASRWAVSAVRENAGEFAAARERAAQCLLMRDIVGNPFRPATDRDEWRTPAVRSLAEELYRSRSFRRLPELAMALIQAGCDDEKIINHCRCDGPHVRGCWVVDLYRRGEDRLQWK